MANKSILPLVAVVVVAAVLISIAYANITGIFAVSGVELVDGTVATIVVAALFILMIPWVYKQAKESDQN